MINHQKLDCLLLFYDFIIMISTSLFFRPFFEGMSHSSSQTEIGSIHSQKSQQREPTCPVSSSLCLLGDKVKTRFKGLFSKERLWSKLSLSSVQPLVVEQETAVLTPSTPAACRYLYDLSSTIEAQTQNQRLDGSILRFMTRKNKTDVEPVTRPVQPERRIYL